MTCHPTRRLLSVRREWTDQERARAEAHLNGCPACQAVAREYELMDRRLDRLPEPALAMALPLVVQRGQQVAKQKLARTEPVSWHLSASQAMLLLSVVVLVIAAFSLMLSRPRIPESDISDLAESIHPLGRTRSLELAAKDGRINTLLMAVDRTGGRNRGWSYRTEAILVLTVNLTDESAAMLSIPRDLQLEIPGVGEDRINVANAYGYLRDYPGGGPELLKQTIEANFGIEIDFYVMTDFDGFVEIVDTMNGIDVDVPETLHDTRYPDSKPDDLHGYKTIHFDAGRQHLSGEQALEYARSRMSTSDFDRAKRQQLLLLAIREKALSLSLVPKLPALVAALDGAVQTDMSLDEMVQLAKLAQEIEASNIDGIVIQEPMVYMHRRENGANVYLPEWDSLNAVIEDLFSTSLESDVAQIQPDDRRFAWPVVGTLTQCFWEGHTAVDVANLTGTPVYAAADGTVAQAGRDAKQGYGNFILLDHGDGYETFYSHLRAIYVPAGTQVSQGQKIGEVGSTGVATGPHLHFEIRQDGEHLNPLVVVPEEARADKLTSSLVPEGGSGQMHLEERKFSWPAEGHVTQAYWIGHQALDIANRSGTPIYAASSGTVKLTAEDTDHHGIHIELEHEDGYTTFYSHLSASHVEVGEHVERMQKIGLMGSTGLSTGPHLHFEIRQDGEPVNPLELLP